MRTLLSVWIIVSQIVIGQQDGIETDTDIVSMTFLYGPNISQDTLCTIHSVDLFNEETIIDSTYTISYICDNMNTIIDICHNSLSLESLSNNFRPTVDFNLTNETDLSFQCLIIFIQNETNITSDNIITLGDDLTFSAEDIIQFTSLSGIQSSYPTIYDSIITNDIFSNFR